MLGSMYTPCRCAALVAVSAGLGAFAWTLAVPLAALAAQREWNCPQVAAVVFARTAAEARNACRGVAQAAAFLARQSVVAGAPIELHLVDALPKAVASPTRIGVYLHEERRAYVLRRSRWPADAAPFGLPITRALHRSAIVHEAVHALTAEHFPDRHVDIVAREYLAYVGQLASLPAALRQQALRAAPESAGDEPRHLNLFVLGMRPDVFAALAWRHWSAPGRGARVVRAVLDNGALPDG